MKIEQEWKDDLQFNFLEKQEGFSQPLQPQTVEEWISTKLRTMVQLLDKSSTAVCLKRATQIKEIRNKIIICLNHDF